MLRWMLRGICLGFAAARDFLFVAEMGFSAVMLEEPLVHVFFGVALVRNSFGFRVGRDVGGLSTWD